MAVYVVGLAFFLLSLAVYSDANYCVCNSGVTDSVLQRNIDYACGAGADCSPILQNGACFNPNTIKDHCNYAVNSYYQRKGNTPGSCSFQGTATVTDNLPSATSGCVYPSSPSNAGSTTPSTTLPTGGTPTTPNTGGTPATTGTFPAGGGTVTPGSPVTPSIGLAPTGTGLGSTDNGSAGVRLLPQSSSSLLVLTFSIILISALRRPTI